MSNRLAIAIRQRMADQGLEGRTGDAARTIGVSYPTLLAVLAGRSKPNKATAPKYQAFLGLNDEDWAHLVSDLRTERGERTPGRRGRRPAAETADDDGPVMATTRRGGDAGGDTADLQRAVRALGALLQDGLALKVHTAPADLRAVIERIVG